MWFATEIHRSLPRSIVNPANFYRNRRNRRSDNGICNGNGIRFLADSVGCVRSFVPALARLERR